MRCPFCAEQDTRVIDSRLAADGAQVRRRRECATCEERFTTFETAELVMPRIIKSDGLVEPFDEDKLRRGMMRSLYKRPVTAEAIDTQISRITHRLRSLGEREIDALKLGEWVMESLRDLDHIAYIRFASVYRQFEDVAEFRETIDGLEQVPSPDLKRHQLHLIEPEDGE